MMRIQSTRTILMAILSSLMLLSTLVSAQNKAAGPVTLVLGGPFIEPEAVKKAVKPLLGSGARVLMPRIPEREDPRPGAFLQSSKDFADLVADLGAVYRMNVRKVVRTHIKRNADEGVEIVITFFSGLETCLRLMQEGLIQPRTVIALDPDPDCVPTIGKSLVKKSTPPKRLNIDVFLSQGSLSRLTKDAETTRNVLKKSGAFVRVFLADLRGRPLQDVIREMRWTLRGLRMVAVRPEGLHEIKAGDLFAALKPVDVVFAGEQHDNKVFHAFQLDLLKSMDTGQGDLLLSMEMFERDVQPVLDRYLAGEIDEAAFLEKSRPWPNYSTDYRPLVEYAKENGIPVLAANVPRRHARTVARKGLAELDELEPEERGYAATEILADSHAYRKQFSRVMMGMDKTRLDRMFKAQCLKDDTMAESIHAYLEAHSAIRRVVHMNGAFHSSRGLGTVQGLKKRRPAVKTAIVTCVAVENPRAVDLVLAEKMDDFLVFAASPLPRAMRGPMKHPGTSRAKRKTTRKMPGKKMPPMKSMMKRMK